MPTPGTESALSRVNLPLGAADEQARHLPRLRRQKGHDLDPIRSSYEDDSDMMEIVREFAEDAANRAETLEELLASGELSELQTLAHQLKGAGGGYGFDPITERAAELEESLKAGADETQLKDRCGMLCETLRAVRAPEST